MTNRNVAHRRPQLPDAVAREPVEDPRPLAARAHQPRPRQHLQMLRGVGDALVDLARDLLDRAFALRKQVDDLSATAAPQRLRDRRQSVEQRRLRRTTGHIFKLSLEDLKNKPCLLRMRRLYRNGRARRPSLAKRPDVVDTRRPNLSRLDRRPFIVLGRPRQIREEIRSMRKMYAPEALVEQPKQRAAAV